MSVTRIKFQEEEEDGRGSPTLDFLKKKKKKKKNRKKQDVLLDVM
jgi:hypothetical protein